MKIRITTPTYVRSTVKDIAIEDVVTTDVFLTETVHDISAALVSLSEKIDNGYDAAVHYINNVSYLKPESDHPLNLAISVYEEPEMSALICTFDSASPSCSAYIEALLVNGTDEMTSEQTLWPDDKMTTVKTQWMPICNISGDSGFGVEYNNAPVAVHLYEWLSSTASLSSIAAGFKKETRLYLKNVWYYTTLSDGAIVYHKSDSYSQLVPSNSELVSYASREDNAAVHVSFSMPVETISYEQNNEWTNDDSFYTVSQGQVNVLANGLSHNVCNIYLDKYSLGAEYRIKFRANTTMVVNNNISDGTKVNIYGKKEILSEFEADGTEFTAGKTYLISIQAGMIQVLAQK